MTGNPTQVLLEVDSRHRVSLGNLARADRYLAHVEDDGTVILIPAVVIPASAATDGQPRYWPVTGSRRRQPKPSHPHDTSASSQR